MDDIQRDISHMERRVRRYWVEDGLADLLSGGLLALVGAYLLLLHLAGEGSVWSIVLALGFPVLLITIGLLSKRWIVLAKDRYVHPRTGYVRYPQRRGHRWAAGLLAGCIAVLVALLVNRAPFIVTWIPALLGLVFGVAFFLAGQKTGLLRYPAQGLLACAAGLLLSALRVEENLGVGALLGTIGLVMAGVGAIVFRVYLRQPLPPEEA